MKRRFSGKAFALAFVAHLLATWWLFEASFRALAEWKRIGVADTGWLTVCAWVLQPVSMFAQHFFRLGWGPSRHFYFLMLPWMIIVALCFAFLVPRVRDSKRQNILPSR